MFFSLLVLSLSLSPQTTRPTGAGTIIGHVVDGVTGQRLSGVTVSIGGGGLPASEKSVSDSDGEFVFRALPVGTYSLGAKRGGYLDGTYGQRRPGGPSRTVKLGEGARIYDLTLMMFKPAAITGTITDEAGEPVVKVEVRAYKRSFASGRPVLAQVNADMTDDRGVYRIGRLLPGDYVIAVPLVTSTPLNGPASTRPARDGGSSATHLPPSDGKLQKFPTTYYVTGQTAPEATVIQLGIGDVRRNADVQVRPQKALNISGSVVVASGSQRGVELSLIAAGEDDISGDRATATAVTGQSGTFAFAAIPVGQYVIRAVVRPARSNAPNDIPQWGEQVIAVNDKDLNDISVLMRTGARISGRVELDSPSDDSGDLMQGLTVSLDPANSRYANLPPPVATTDASSKTFAISNVLPGRYLIRVTPSGNRSVKSVMYQGRDVSQVPVAIEAADLNGLIVTLTDRPTIVAGTVSGTDVGESTVLLFPQDMQTWTDFGATSATVRTIDVNDSGTFEVRGVPAGDYWLVAFDQDTFIDAQNPAFLQAAVRLATRLRLGNGEKQTVDLKIVSIK